MRIKEIALLAKRRLEQAEVKAENINKEAEKAIDYFNKEVVKILPKDDFYKAQAQRMGKSETAPVVIFFIREKQSVTWHNDYIGTQLMMHLADGFGKVVDKDSFEIELNTIGPVKRKGLKFRKIKGKDPMDCMKKLLAWVKKNKDILIGE